MVIGYLLMENDKILYNEHITTYHSYKSLYPVLLAIVIMDHMPKQPHSPDDGT